MSEETGEAAGPLEMTEMVERLESGGESPDAIEASMPDLGGDDAGLPFD
ncbi:MAG: hypothetical protein R2851_05155 [Caldilineaceae bacterium]